MNSPLLRALDAAIEVTRPPLTHICVPKACVGAKLFFCGFLPFFPFGACFAFGAAGLDGLEDWAPESVGFEYMGFTDSLSLFTCGIMKPSGSTLAAFPVIWRPQREWLSWMQRARIWQSSGPIRLKLR